MYDTTLGLAVEVPSNDIHRFLEITKLHTFYTISKYYNIFYFNNLTFTEIHFIREYDSTVTNLKISCKSLW